MKKKLKKLVPKRPEPEPTLEEQGKGRITNDTVAAHREEVLSSARKYIYPLQHSKHKVVMITTSIIVAAIVIFMSYSVVALYKLDSTSSFLYRMTQVVPFPVAKAGSRFVSYENYLFELRHYMYFYVHQQKLDFGTEAGQQQLEDYKKRALEKVINDAYVKQLASQHKISVSSQEVDNQITILRRQNRLGGSEQAYEDALRQNFGWTASDFKRVIRQQLLEQKVVSALDTATHEQANKALADIQAGKPFDQVAAEAVQSGSNVTAGVYESVDSASRDLSPITTDALFKLQPGETSDIINTGYSLQILKNLETGADGKIKAAYINFEFKDINSYINDLKDKEKARQFINP